jgi:MFS family permease
VGSAVFNGFMAKLGAGDLVYSIVLALPVLGGMSQIFGSYLVETTGRRRFIFLSCGIVHRALWIPVALIPLFLPSARRATPIIWAISVLITVSSVAASVSSYRLQFLDGRPRADRHHRALFRQAHAREHCFRPWSPRW